MGERRISGDSPSANHRLTVPEAAAELGITEAAVRGRVKRGTLRSYRESGTVYVVLVEGDTSETNRDASTDKPTDQSELVEELRSRVRALEEANRENRRIIAALTSRIPQLEAPRDEPRSAETVAEEPSGTSSPPEPETPSSRRSWWRRWFGFE